MRPLPQFAVIPTASAFALLRFALQKFDLLVKVSKDEFLTDLVISLTNRNKIAATIGSHAADAMTFAAAHLGLEAFSLEDENEVCIAFEAFALVVFQEIRDMGFYNGSDYLPYDFYTTIEDNIVLKLQEGA